MTVKDQFEEFVFNIQTMPRDELAAYLSILVGLLLIILAVLLWFP